MTFLLFTIKKKGSPQYVDWIEFILKELFTYLNATVWGTPTLLVNKKLWSYHKVVLDLWWAGIWLKVSIVYQFHEAKSRYLSSEPGHWFKKQLSKFSWNQSKVGWLKNFPTLIFTIICKICLSVVSPWIMVKSKSSKTGILIHWRWCAS